MPTVVLDWDGTLVEHLKPPEQGDWLYDPASGMTAVDFIKALKKRGFTPVVDSCRASYLVGQTMIREKLRDAGLKIDIHTEPNKPRAIAYVDDRAVPVEQDNPDYAAALRRILELA